MEPKEFMDLRKRKKGMATSDTSKIAKRPEEVSQMPLSDTDVDQIIIENNVRPGDDFERDVADLRAQSMPAKEVAKQEAVQLLEQEAPKEQQREVVAQVTGKPVEDVIEEERMSGGLSNQFKAALSNLAPSAVGMLVGGLVGGSEGAVAGFQQGTALGKGLRDEAVRDRTISVQEGQLAQSKANQERVAQFQASEAARKASKTDLNLDLKAKGMGSAPVSFQASTGKYFVGDKEVAADDIQNTKYIMAARKAQTEALKATEGVDKADLKDILGAKKFADGRMKDLGLQDIAVSASRLKELSQLTPDKFGDIKVNALSRGKEGPAIKFKDPSAARDAAIIINFMKLADPGSVVREGEFKMAANLGPLGESIKAAWLKRTEGPMLTDRLRSELVEAAYAQAEGAYKAGKLVQDDTIRSLSNTGIDANLLKDPALSSIEATLGITSQPQGPSRDDSIKSKLFTRGK